MRGLSAPQAGAQPTGNATLAYVPGSAVKLEQVIGDCDWQVQARNDYHGHQPLASSATTDPEAGLILNFWPQERQPMAPPMFLADWFQAPGPPGTTYRASE